ncbi:MAG: TonB-dependent receptor [Halioglobus sp.]|nr:TonB-dependent receptor [Halioglobus sp.]
MKITTIAGGIAASALAAYTFPTSAADVAGIMEEVVVTSSRVPTPLRQIGTSVSVINQTDIERLGYDALYNVLRTQPGVQVSNQGGPGSITSLRIRGEENYRTGFYLDGIDISDTSSPQTTTRVEHIMSSSVQRVEILRGPQGLMYGSDAGGVVTITTIAPSEGLNGSISAEGGRYDTRQYAANVNGGNGTLDFSLSGSDYDSDLYNARTTDTDLRDDDGYENTTLHGRLGWNITDDLRLSFVGRDVDADAHYDGCYTVTDFSSSNACSDEFEQESWRAAANYNTERFTHEVFYTSNETRRKNYTEGQFSFGLGGELERTGYIGSFNSSDALKLVYGVDLLSESTDDSSVDDRDQESAYAEYQGGFRDSIYVTAGVRYDDNDDFGSTTTYRLSGAYLVPVADGEMKFRASYGTGFRFPSLFEIANNGFSFTPVPELSEEESEGYDLAVSWTDNASVYVEAVYFDQTISDEIFYDNASFVYLQKTGDTQSEGVELYGRWNVLDALSIDGNYTYTDSQDINGDPRARRPEHMANLGLTFVTLSDKLSLGLHARLSQDAIDVDGSQLDDYEVLDFTARLQLLHGLEVFGRVENLTDEDYQEVPTYYTSGAAGYLGVKYSF